MPSGRGKVNRAALLKDVFFPVSSLPVCSLAVMWLGVSSATHPYFHNSLPPAKPKATESADRGLKSVQMNQKRTFPPRRVFHLGYLVLEIKTDWLATHSCRVLHSTEVLCFRWFSVQGKGDQLSVDGISGLNGLFLVHFLKH